jgi:hypothetical protein
MIAGHKILTQNFPIITKSEHVGVDIWPKVKIFARFNDRWGLTKYEHVGEDIQNRDRAVSSKSKNFLLLFT